MTIDPFIPPFVGGWLGVCAAHFMLRRRAQKPSAPCQHHWVFMSHAKMTESTLKGDVVTNSEYVATNIFCAKCGDDKTLKYCVPAESFTALASVRDALTGEAQVVIPPYVRKE